LPTPEAKPPLFDATLKVALFDDARRSQPRAAILFEKPTETEHDGAKRCINSEEGYEPGTVAPQVSEMIGQTLARRGSFARVIWKTPEPADYQLTGSIKALYGMQKYPWGAAVAAGFGVAGAGLSSRAKSEGEVYVLLKDLAITNRSGQTIARLPDAETWFEGEMPADPECDQIYTNVNFKLKEAVDKLAASIDAALAARRSAGATTTVPITRDGWTPVPTGAPIVQPAPPAAAPPPPPPKKNEPPEFPEPLPPPPPPPPE